MTARTGRHTRGKGWMWFVLGSDARWEFGSALNGGLKRSAVILVEKLVG